MTSKNALAPLLPDRYPQHDLFICDVSDAILKDIMQHMEHPFYSLSKKPDTQIRRYEHNGNWIEITPSVKGLATIYDKDILIYCISQIMTKLKDGQKLESPRIRINSHELLQFTNRGTAGKDYEALSKAIDRLAGTRISTNIKSGDEEQYDNFGLIDAASIRRKNGLDGRLLYCEVKLSDWIFKAIRANEVLTLHPDYFRLRKPLERRVYELARKHCGQQPQWSISLEKLLYKSGSRSGLRQFRQMIKGLADNNHLPDYTVLMHKDKVTFKKRNFAASIKHNFPLLQDKTLEIARCAAPGYDVYGLKEDWLSHWVKSGKPTLKNADAAFIGFCKNRHQRKPMR